MKKLINKPDKVVSEMLEGLVAANSDKLRLVPEKKIVLRKSCPVKDKVALLTGSGSGHEPDQVWFVGKGMLDAGCAGEVFAAPTMDAVYEATKMVDAGRGVLYLVKNFSGDRMSFDMAKEMAEAEGIKIETVLINEDVAVEDSTYTAGRRGMAGAIFAYKIVGARAEEMASIDELKALGEKVNANIRSMGMALTSCTTPAKGSPTFQLGDDEMEMGVGIHGEPGTKRVKVKSADEIVEDLMDRITEDLPYKEGDEVAVIVNGLGGTPVMELYIVFKKVAEYLNKKGIKIFKTYIGEYVTSLDMAGCSISLLKLLNDEMKRLLVAPVHIPLAIF